MRETEFNQFHLNVHGSDSSAACLRDKMSEMKDHASSQPVKRGGSSSFSRLENSSPFSRIDATATNSTEALQAGVDDPLSVLGAGAVEESGDVFEKKDSELSHRDGEDPEQTAGQPSVELPEQFAELPIELVINMGCLFSVVTQRVHLNLNIIIHQYKVFFLFLLHICRLYK